MITAKNKVKSCIMKLWDGTEVDVTKALDMPLTVSFVLDETLDTAKITLSDMRTKDYPSALDVSTAFEPFTRITITFEDEKGSAHKTKVDMLISHDDCKMQRKSNDSWRSYKHEIQLVEQTKLLERLSVDTLTFLNPVKREYDSKAAAVWGYTSVTKTGSVAVTGGDWDNRGEWNAPEITSMVVNIDGYLTISDNASSFNHYVPVSGSYSRYISSLYAIVTLPNGREQTYYFGLVLNGKEPGALAADDRKYIDETFTIHFDTSGEYKIVFYLNWVYSVTSGLLYSSNVTATTYLYANPKSSEVAPYSLSDTITRLLDVTPLRSKSEENLYSFNSAQLEEYAKEESPEFSFAGQTLFEALLIIAQYKGAFPELNGSEISFRNLWNGTRLADDDLPDPIEELSSSDCNQYCTYLETEVQNLVGINDSQTGSIVEPYAGGYKTTRAESGSEISQDTAIISTDYNQYLHIKEEIGCIGDEFPSDNDLTNYIYESGDYNALTDSVASYPASKAYALEWTQMSKNITELAHRVTGATSLSQALQAPALANIINAKTGVDYDTGIVAYIKNLLDVITNGEHSLDADADSFADLMFRTTYIPVIDSRIKQYKEHLGEFHYDGSIKYNQTAELVDSEMYGEHLKGLLRKIGNKTKRVIYIFDNIDDVPEIGTIVGDYSVYNVSMSIREDKVVATIYYVKYAELSQYIGVKNAWKDSDVSTEKCYSRQISYNEFILITHNSKEEGTSEALTDTGLIYILPQGGGNADVITCVEATGYTSDGTALNTVLLPVVSLAMGNSIMFQWEYKNNYSAGYMSEVAPTEATSLLSGTRYNRCQKAVKYADNYGKLKTYSFSLLHEGPTASNSHWLEDDGTLINGGTNNNEKNAAITRNIAHSLPLKADNIKEEVEYESGEDGEESTIKYEAWEGLKYVDVKDLLIEKNSGEALKFSVQFHYCTDQDDIIIGSGLTNYCPLVGGSMDVVWSLYMFKRRLNYCDRRIDISDAVYGGYIGQKINRPQQRIEIELPDEINGYLSWAIVGRKNGLNYQLIFGENRAFNGANFDRNLYIVPKHKV